MALTYGSTDMWCDMPAKNPRGKTAIVFRPISALADGYNEFRLLTDINRLMVHDQNDITIQIHDRDRMCVKLWFRSLSAKQNNTTDPVHDH